jgi:hypothetical protein
MQTELPSAWPGPTTVSGNVSAVLALPCAILIDCWPRRLGKPICLFPILLHSAVADGTPLSVTAASKSLQSLDRLRRVRCDRNRAHRANGYAIRLCWSFECDYAARRHSICADANRSKAPEFAPRASVPPGGIVAAFNWAEMIDRQG